jgi:hypothetical protein
MSPVSFCGFLAGLGRAPRAPVGVQNVKGRVREGDLCRRAGRKWPSHGRARPSRGRPPCGSPQSVNTFSWSQVGATSYHGNWYLLALNPATGQTGHEKRECRVFTGYLRGISDVRRVCTRCGYQNLICLQPFRSCYLVYPARMAWVPLKNYRGALRQEANGGQEIPLAAFAWCLRRDCGATRPDRWSFTSRCVSPNHFKQGRATRAGRKRSDRFIPEPASAAGL